MNNNAKITDFIKREDIDIENKIGNMHESEISEEIYIKIIENPVLLGEIEANIWAKLNDNDNPLSKASAYEGLADDYETDDENERWGACLYNHDLIYMQAIAEVLGLPVPKEAGRGMLVSCNE